jgi:hypothetical protein
MPMPTEPADTLTVARIGGYFMIFFDRVRLKMYGAEKIYRAFTQEDDTPFCGVSRCKNDLGGILA